MLTDPFSNLFSKRKGSMRYFLRVFLPMTALLILLSLLMYGMRAGRDSRELLSGFIVLSVPLLIVIFLVSLAIGQAWALREHAEASLRFAAQVMETTRDGIMVTDRQGVIEMVNRAFSEITGYAQEEVLGKGKDLLRSGHHDAEFYQKMETDLAEKGEWEGEVWNRNKNGAVYPEWLRMRVISSEAGQRIISVFSDISESKQSELNLQFMASHDPLTRLSNRSVFQNQLRHALALARRNRQMLAVLFVDLDNFNEINSTFGHSAGDRVLQGVANRLQMCVRESDTVARVGGDEFCIVLENLVNRENIIQAVERIMTTLAAPYQLGEQDYTLTASIGVSVYPDDGQDVESLLQQADIAMYRIKDRQKNNFEFFS